MKCTGEEVSTLQKADDWKRKHRAIPNLLHPDEKTVDVVSWRAGVQGLFVLLDLCLDKVSQEVSMFEHSVVGTRKTLHDGGKDIVHLWETFTAIYFLKTNYLVRPKMLLIYIKTLEPFLLLSRIHIRFVRLLPPLT